MKKAIVMICLVCMIGNIFGAVLETVSGEKISGKIVGKRDGVYYIENSEGMKAVNVEDVVRLMNGKINEANRYAMMRDWGKDPTIEMRLMAIDPELLIDYEQMTPFERAYLIQMQEMNRNTKNISSTMIGIAVIGFIFGVISAIITNAQLKESHDSKMIGVE